MNTCTQADLPTIRFLDKGNKVVATCSLWKGAGIESIDAFLYDLLAHYDTSREETTVMVHKLRGTASKPMQTNDKGSIKTVHTYSTGEIFTSLLKGLLDNQPEDTDINRFDIILNPYELGDRSFDSQTSQ